MTKKEFIKKLEENKISLTEKQIQQFEDYFYLLKEWNEKINLTTITEEEKVYEKHFYDSLTVLFSFDFKNKKVLDIGTGAGFPSIPLKIVEPSIELTVLDSVAKKMKFIEELSKKLEIKVEIIAARAEDYIKENREKFDVVTSRAVAKLNVLMELSSPYLKKGGTFIALKGVNGQEEFHQARRASEILKLNLSTHQIIELPEEKATRHNYFYTKVDKTPIKYPRPYNKIKQNPLTNNM